MTGNGNEGRKEASARWLAALAGVLGLLFAPALFYPLLRGNMYLGSDLGAYHLPVRTFYSHCLKEGVRFWWWPDQFCGYYIHGEGQGGMLHPFHLLIYRSLPLDWAFNLEFVSGYAVAYAGMVALLRRWSLPWFAALFGANCFAFSGFTLIHFMHLQAIAIIGHLPWMLLAADVLLKSERRRGIQLAWAALALLSASQLLLGYPQYVLFTLLALGLYSAFNLYPRCAPGRILNIASALLTGLLLAGVQVVPTFDVLQTALRNDNADSWRSASLHPLNLLQWSGPYWFNNHLAFGEPAHEFGLYAGVAPMLLGLWLLTQWSTLGLRRAPALFCGVLAALSLVLALGEYGGLYGLLAKLPVIGSFRCAARHIVLIHFALALLTALGAQRLQCGPSLGSRRPLHLVVALAWGMAVFVPSLCSLASASIRDAITDSPVLLVAGPALVTLAVAGILLARRTPSASLAALMVLATLDMGVYALPHVWSHAPQSSRLESLEGVLREELPQAMDERDAALYRAHGNWRVARLTQVGLANYMGYVGLPPAWTLDPNADVTKRLAGVRWEKRPLQASQWTAREDALPRARFVSASVSGDPAALLDGRTDVAKVAITERSLELEAGEPGNLTWARDDPGDVAFATHTATSQLLVFAERHHPGWRVTVDGDEVPLERVYGDFMGCVVPAGQHDVTFHFAPTSLRVGAALSAAGVIAMVLGWIVTGRTGRMQQAGAPDRAA